MSLGTDGGLEHPSSMGPLRPELPVWELLGRTLLVAVGHILIVPSPWTSTSFYRFLCEHIALPDGRRLKFTGQPGDIWYVFIALSAVGWIHPILDHSGLSRSFGLAMTVATWALMVPVIQWFCANVKPDDGRLSLAYNGGYWAYIGWNILLIVSFVTIVGWAWVLKFMMRWLCRNVHGTICFDFTATGLDILWRTVVFLLASVLVIPIPWAMQWYANWVVSRISVVTAAGTGPAA